MKTSTRRNPDARAPRVRARLALLVAALVAAVLPAAHPAEAAAQGPDPVTIADSLAHSIHRAFIVGDRDGLRQARTLATRGLMAHPEHPLLEHHRAESLFREATVLLDEDPDLAQGLLDDAQDYLDTAVELPGVIAETHALRASVLGLRITGMVRAMTLGPQAGSAVERAIEADPESPRVWLASGIGTLNEPGFLGGGEDPALEELQRADELAVDHERAPGHPVSSRAEIQAWIGVVHAQAGRIEPAVAAFRTALELEPDFAWVRDVLLPQAESRLSGAGVAPKSMAILDIAGSVS